MKGEERPMVGRSIGGEYFIVDVIDDGTPLDKEVDMTGWIYTDAQGRLRMMLKMKTHRRDFSQGLIRKGRKLKRKAERKDAP